MFNKVHIFAIIQTFIAFLTGLYITSLSEKRLIVGDNIFSEATKNYILSHYIGALVIFAILTIVVHYLSHKDTLTKSDKQIYDNICESVFDNFIKSEANYNNSDFRVSLFKTKIGFYFKDGIWYKLKRGTVLYNVARHQTTQEKKLSSIRYLPNEGCVGICYLNSVVHFLSMTANYNATNPDVYHSENERMSNLPKRKSKKVRIKSVSFVSCPIKYFKSDDLFGVIIVDCIQTQSFQNSNFRLIEDTINKYSVFFNKKN